MTGKAKESLAIFHQALAETTKDAFIYKDMGVAMCSFPPSTRPLPTSSGDGDRSQ